MALDVDESEEKEAIVLIHLIKLVSMFDVFKRLSHVKFEQANAPQPPEFFEVLHWKEVEDYCIDCRVQKARIHRGTPNFSLIDKRSDVFWKDTANNVKEVHTMK